MGESPQGELQPLGPASAGRPRRRLLLAGLVLAAVGVVLAVLVGSGVIRLDRGPSAPDQTARIAIVGRAGALSTIAADGTDRRSYSMPGVAFQYPAWSPDGSQVAAIGHDASEDGGVFVIRDRPTQTGAAAPIVAYRSPKQALIYLYWSPDGRRIAFLTSEPNELALQVVAADGTGSAAVVRRGQPLYWDWIDGSHLFVHSGGDALDAFLGEVGVDVPEASPIAASVGPFQAPGISSGGRYRAYVVVDASQSASVVVEARGSSARHEAAIRGPSALGWSPDGDQLAYIAPAQAIGLPLGPLHLIDAGSGATRLLLDGPVVAYFWAPDARTIAALRIALPGDDSVAAIPAIARMEGRPIAQGEGLPLGTPSCCRSSTTRELCTSRSCPRTDRSRARSRRALPPSGARNRVGASPHPQTALLVSGEVRPGAPKQHTLEPHGCRQRVWSPSGSRPAVGRTALSEWSALP